MRLPHTLHRHAIALAAGLALGLGSVSALADPPGRAGRLGYLSGTVSFSPAGDEDWGRAVVNRPLTTGDKLWVDADGRAEVQLGGTTLRLKADTAVSVLNLDDDLAQVQLSEGSMNVHVRRLDRGQSVEIDTPHLAFVLREPGQYRIDVDSEGRATTVHVREGRGEVSGENASYVLDAPQVQRFVGDAQRDAAYASAPTADDFDRWATDRDTVYARSVSARYVSPDVIGYEDLDDTGSWRVEASYGNVWVPRGVPAGWAPYRDGHWAWVDPWGWTWIDDARWGYAVSHYGRWASIRGTWAWVPGPPRVRATYAPALVAFVGGPNFSLSISSGGSTAGVAWFPLGPREVYRPAYKVSPTYFERVNVSNTVVSTTVVRNVYVNKTVTNVTYVNQRVPNAIVAVPAKAFAESQPVAKVVVKAPKTVIETKVVINDGPAIAPTVKSLHGGNEAVSHKPPPAVMARTVVARTQPPPPPPSFASTQQRLAAKPGKPLDDEERHELQASAAKAAPSAGTSPSASGTAAAPQAPKVKVAKATAPQPLPAATAKASGPQAGEAKVAGAEPGASKPERQAAADKEKDKADKLAKADKDKADKDKADQEDKVAKADKGKADKAEKTARAASGAPAPGERQAAAERPRGAASGGRETVAGSKGEAMDAVGEAERRAPAAGRAASGASAATAAATPADRQASAAERRAARQAAQRGDAASATKPPRAAARAEGASAAAGMSREDKRAAREAAQAQRGASAADGSRRPAAERARTKPAPSEPGDQPAAPATARAPHAPASAASHPKKRGEEGQTPS